ncbi:MAG: hypothetical protein LBC88_02630 [Spirochaetaceae bacterium]|nr:hypothetical protein [Spirochaetaceae bacterium]
MTFGERMKELLGQGVAATKDIASKAGEQAQIWGEKGYQASKDFLKQAGVKAQNLGEQGVLKLEIKKLEGRAQSLMGRLGAEVYSRFVEAGAASVAADDQDIAALIGEISAIRENIEKREADLQMRRESQGG